MPGRVVGRPVFDVRAGPVRSGVMLGALLVEADMLRARAVRRGWEVHMQPRLDGRQLLDLALGGLSVGSDMLRSRYVFRRWRLRVLQRLGRRELLHLREEPVRADDVRRGLLTDPHMRPPWKVLRRRTVLMFGQLELAKLLCLFAWPLRGL